MTAEWSLGEVEALARKAARGAGCSWGLAEEAGRAVRWLAARGLPGPEALVALLAWRDGLDHAAVVPVPGPEGWAGLSGPVCPIVAGAMLCDGLWPGGQGALQLGPVVQPLLLLPFAAWLAQARRQALGLSWGETAVTLAPGGGLAREGPLLAAAPARVRIGAEAMGRAAIAVPGNRARADGAVVAALERLAARTYAPATEASRLVGAGAGLSDND